jgi:hypothetical protein
MNLFMAASTWNLDSTFWVNARLLGSQEGYCFMEFINDTVICISDYRRDFGLDDWIYWHLINTTPDYRQLQRYYWSTNFRYSSPLHTHDGFQSSLVVSLQRIYKSHCHLKPHMKSSCRNLIPFLPLFSSCQFRKLDSVPFFCSQAHIPAG